jgi:hypothetical protein
MKVKKNILKIIGILCLTLCFMSGCVGYDKTAFVHESDLVRIPDLVKKVTFTLPNGNTYTMISNLNNGNRSMSLLKIKKRNVVDFNFDESGGFLDMKRNGEQSIRVQDHVLYLKNAVYDGQRCEQFRMVNSYSLIPFD